MEILEQFVAGYRKAGGTLQLEKFEGRTLANLCGQMFFIAKQQVVT